MKQLESSARERKLVKRIARDIRELDAIWGLQRLLKDEAEWRSEIERIFEGMSWLRPQGNHLGK